MLASTLLCALTLALVSPAPASGSSTGKNEKVPPPADNTEVIEDLLDRFAESMRNRPAGLGRDAETATLLVADLSLRFDGCGPNDRKDIVKSFVRGFERFERKEGAGREFAFSVANALGSMGPESVEPLLDLVTDKQVDADVDLHRRLILSLGRTRDEQGLSRLKRLLHHEEPATVAAAAEALGEFEELEEAKRKEVFYALLSRLLDAKHLVDQDEFNLSDRRRYETIIGAMTTSLQRLTHHDERDPEEWLRFWNKNKQKPWGTTSS